VISSNTFEESFLSLQCGGGKQKEEELKRQGWVRQFVTDEPRLSEAVELYKTLGYEVRLEEATFEEVNQICKNCLEADCERYKIIYIKKSRSK
jgi:hypothetical protein